MLASLRHLPGALGLVVRLVRPPRAAAVPPPNPFEAVAVADALAVHCLTQSRRAGVFRPTGRRGRRSHPAHECARRPAARTPEGVWQRRP